MRVLAWIIAVGFAIALEQQTPAAQSTTEPLAVARILAAKYPAQPIMSYIPALAWSSSLRLSELTGEPQWREKALEGHRGIHFADRTPAMAEPYRLTSLAGALAFADAWTIARDGAAQNAGDGSSPVIHASRRLPAELIRFATGWTDDMFMASAVLSRVGSAAHAEPIGRMLTQLRTKSCSGPMACSSMPGMAPHAWGRGNGFALLGVTEALTHLPDSWSDRAACLASIAGMSRRSPSCNPMTAAGARSSTIRPVIAS